MLSRLRLGPKLMLAPMLVLVVMFLVFCMAYGAIARQGQALETVVQQRAAQTRSAAELAAGSRQAHAEVYQLIAWISASFSQARTDTLVRGIHRRHAAIERSFASLQRITRNDADEAALVRQADRAWRVYLASVLDVMALARNDQTISANAMTRSEQAFDTVLLRLDALTRLEQLMGERAAADAQDDGSTIATLMPVALMSTFALILLMTMALRRTLLDEIDAVVAASIALGEGDLRAMPRFAGRDEICSAGRALAVAREQLNRRLQLVLDGARAVGALAGAGAGDKEVQEQALALSRSVMAFRLDDTMVALPPPRRAPHKKGMPGPVWSGHPSRHPSLHPYLRLAVSRR